MRRHYEFDNERGDMYFVRTDPENSEVGEGVVVARGNPISSTLSPSPSSLR